MRSPRWCAFISGRGSNLGALLEARAEADGLFDLALVVSSRSDAQGLARARAAGVPTMVLAKKIDWPALTDELRARGVSHVFLLGFMRIVAPEFCRAWQGRLFNLHPSLLPAYPGLESIARALADGADVGATVHEAVEAVDAGRIVAQRRTLRGAEAQARGLEASEFLVHVDEQRLVKGAATALSRRALADRFAAKAES